MELIQVDNVTKSIDMSLFNHHVPIISDDVRILLRTINHGFICQLVDIFGSITNIVNMVIFAKIGFSETINLSLFALALSDFGSCFTLIWINICALPWFQELDLPFDPNQIQFLISSWPHVLFTRITTLITAFIMVERCLCVTVPLKVKRVITRKRVTIFLVGTYLLVLGSAVPIYYSHRYAWKFYPRLNKTLVGLVVTDDKDEIEAILGPLQNAFFAMFPFVFICICTAILVESLKRKAAWREKATTVAKTGELSTKENRVAKMVIIISALFIICFFPNMVVNMLMMSNKDISISGKERNVLMTLGSLVFTLESINSATNIFVYHRCSTNYRTAFNEVFQLGEKEK